MQKMSTSFYNKKTTTTVAIRKDMVASRRKSNRRHRDFKVNCSNAIFFLNNKKMTVKTASFRKEMVARDGIEPPTQGFSVPCSTN